MGVARILLVDDHCIVRQGIKALLQLERDMTVVGEASDGATALALIDELKPDLVLLDAKMSDMDGVEVCRQAMARHPNQSIVILTAFPSQDSVLQCIRAGAKGYVLKDVDVTELVRTVRAIRRGESVLDPKVAGAVMNALRRQSPGDGGRPALSEREVEITRLMAQGLTNQEIAWKLYLSTSTVKLHLRKIEDKLGVAGRTAVVYEASKQGLI
ncbi:MAG TPA: response regulator transcription factor [Chloroflexota bacterium]|nr:response regulator transcription factor [Chloroflexota bacterium]